MPVNWQDTKIWDRLFTAFLASTNNKIDTAEVARLFGEGMTYHALENQLRKVKKEATRMKEEAAGRKGAAPSAAKPRAQKGGARPIKTAGAVKTGRVAKKPAPKSKVKIEEAADDEIDFDDLDEHKELQGGDVSLVRMDDEDSV